MFSLLAALAGVLMTFAEKPHLADLSPALDDGHSQYVSGVPLVGGDLQRGSPLPEAAGGALGACREFLK